MGPAATADTSARSLIGIAAAAAGVVVFAVFAHQGLPWLTVGAGGLAIAALAIGWSGFGDSRPAELLGLDRFSRKIAVFTVVAGVLGAVAGLAYLVVGAGVDSLAGIDPAWAASSGMLLFVWALLLLTLAVQVVMLPYLGCRLQNLLWSRTGNRAMRFRSRLRLRPWLGLHIKNWLLMLLTLGLYWPFAAVATTRMRLHAITVVTRVDPADLVEEARALQGDAAGDAAGDLLGLDIGL